MRNSPTTVEWARFRTLTISPSARPPGSMRAMRTTTRSPCMAFCGRFGRNEDVAVHPWNRTFGDQEAVTVAVHVEAADGEFAAAVGDDITAVAQFDEVAAGGQAGQRGFQRDAVFSFAAKLADQLLEVRPGVRQAGDMIEQCPVRHIPILLATPATLIASSIALE